MPIIIRRGGGRSATIMCVSTHVEVDQPGTGGWRVLAPFRFREYRLLIGALSISIFAEGMWAVVMAMQVIALDNDPASLSLVATCLGTGLVAFVLVGGIAADRLNQRSIIIAVESVNTAAVLTVATLSSLGLLRIWQLAVAAGALGIAAAFFFPAYSAMLPRILPAEQLLAANGVEGVVRPVFQRAVGPAVAGVLVGVTFPALGAFAVAALFAVGLILLVATRPPKPVAARGDQGTHVLRDMRDGVRFMLRTPWLLWTVLFASVFVLVVLGPIEVLQYSPLPQQEFLRPVLETSADDLLAAVEFSILGPRTAVQHVLPGMRELGRGTILFVNGTSAVRPNPKVAGTSIAFAGLSAYASMLHDTLAGDGIHVGQLIVPGVITAGDPDTDPGVLAERLWQMHITRAEFRTFAEPLPG